MPRTFEGTIIPHPAVAIPPSRLALSGVDRNELLVEIRRQRVGALAEIRRLAQISEGVPSDWSAREQGDLEREVRWCEGQARLLEAAMSE